VYSPLVFVRDFRFSSMSGHRTPLLPPLQRISQSRAGSSDINNVPNIGQAYHQSKCGKQLLTLIG
jgi:hypothetical protein